MVVKISVTSPVALTVIDPDIGKLAWSKMQTPRLKTTVPLAVMPVFVGSNAIMHMPLPAAVPIGAEIERALTIGAVGRNALLKYGPTAY